MSLKNAQRLLGSQHERKSELAWPRRRKASFHGVLSPPVGKTARLSTQPPARNSKTMFCQTIHIFFFLLLQSAENHSPLAFIPSSSAACLQPWTFFTQTGIYSDICTPQPPHPYPQPPSPPAWFGFTECSEECKLDLITNLFHLCSKCSRWRGFIWNQQHSIIVSKGPSFIIFFST